MPSGVSADADLGAAELLEARLEALLQRMAEGVVGGDEEPLLAELVEQDLRHRIGLHARRIADAEDVPVAVLAGDRIGMAARSRCSSVFSSFDAWPRASAMEELTLPSRKLTLSRSISLRAFCTAVPTSPLVESSTRSSTWRPRMPPLALICSTASSAADPLVLAQLRIGAGQRIVEADLDAAPRPAR